MSYLKCLLIFFVIDLVSSGIDNILKVCLKEDLILPILVRIFIGLTLGGYLIYYLVNVYM